MSENGIEITPGDPEEFASLTEIKIDKGIEYDIASERSQQWIERKFDSPTTLYDEPVPWEFWLAVAVEIRKVIRIALTDHLREARVAALQFTLGLAKTRSNILRPFFEQIALQDMLSAMEPELANEAKRCFREACYLTVNNEFMGRGVG